MRPRLPGMARESVGPEMLRYDRGHTRIGETVRLSVEIGAGRRLQRGGGPHRPAGVTARTTVEDQAPSVRVGHPFRNWRDPPSNVPDLHFFPRHMRSADVGKVRECAGRRGVVSRDQAPRHQPGYPHHAGSVAHATESQGPQAGPRGMECDPPARDSSRPGGRANDSNSRA
jgi:hypothetical protein